MGEGWRSIPLRAQPPGGGGRWVGRWGLPCGAGPAAGRGNGCRASAGSRNHPGVSLTREASLQRYPPPQIPGNVLFQAFLVRIPPRAPSSRALAFHPLKKTQNKQNKTVKVTAASPSSSPPPQPWSVTVLTPGSGETPTGTGAEEA